MPSDGDSIYSPETSRQVMVQAKQEHEQVMVAFANQMRARQLAFDNEKRELEVAKALVLKNEDNNWIENNRIRAEKAILENELAVMKRDMAIVEQREKQVAIREDQRRRNRTVSETFLEESFAILSPRDVVAHLTNSSLKIRKHARLNISVCIAGGREYPPNCVRFTPHDIAPHILPTFHTLLSTSKEPLEDVIGFTEEVVSNPLVAKALALNGQCTLLADYLIEQNKFTSRMAICSLRRMTGMETSVVKLAYEAMSRVVSQIPIPELNQSHPAIDFVKEVAPKIIEDCFNNGLWSSVAPLVSHRITAIREVVLHKVKLLSQYSDRNQHGLVEAHVLGFLDQYYSVPSPLADVVDFFVDILPMIAERLCRRRQYIEWLLVRLSDPSSKINAAVIAAFQMAVVKQDPTVLQKFVKEDLLKKLSEPPTQPSHSISKLICQLLPVLAIPYAYSKAGEGIITFLDHSEPAVADACLKACIRIVESTLENRTHLFAVISRLNFAKASTLRLYDHAMPAFCKDWVTSCDFKMIVQFLQHSEPRVRHPAQKVWCDIVCNSTSSHANIVHDGLLDEIFELCNSQYDDAVSTGAKCCSPLAIEITKAGIESTRKLVELLSHPRPLLRESALRAIQRASESNDTSCKMLLEANTFKALQLFLETYPKELPEHARKILIRLAPFLHTSTEACMGLLQLLESSSSVIENAAKSSLTVISNSNIEGRQTLRSVVLNKLQLPTDALVEYSTKAIRDWIGPDLAQLSDFASFFNLISHSDKRIQTAALVSLRQKLSNSDHQESLERANVVTLIRTLSNSDNSESFIFIMEALPVLALSLARNGHTGAIIDLLMHKEPNVREGAAAALEAIARGSGQERKQLLEEEIIEILIGHDERLEQTQLHLLSSIIPKLAIDYLNAGKMELILELVDHQQQQIRVAATKSVEIIVGGTMEQKKSLQDVLFPRLEQNPSPALRQVAANCFSRALAHDFVVDGDFVRLFSVFNSEDVRVRQPIIKELHGHIQRSDERARRGIVEAGILPAILQAYTSAKDDLVSFLSTCVLPVLGPAFTQNDGGSTLFPLLTHGEPQIRAATIQALKNALDSRHGNVESLAKACVIETLHPMMANNDAIRDLWCRILPKIAPFLANRAEIDMLFGSLNDNRQIVREAASDALIIMSKTSDVTRGHIFPALLHFLDNPTSEALPLISKVVSRSGSIFILNNKETELFHLILKGEPDIAAAAVYATTKLLAKGTSFEHQKLLNGDIFYVALELYNGPQRQLSLELLRAIISHLSYVILTYDELAVHMCSLFDDPDLASTLYQTWSNDERVYENLPELVPLLLEDDKLRNPSVVALLRQLAPFMVRMLVLRKRLDIVVKTLKVPDANVVQGFLSATCTEVENANEREKDFFVTEPGFVSVIGRNLEGRDVTLRRDSSTIVELLSEGSSSRSGTIMKEGIGKHLSWVAVHGENWAQQSSLDALYSLFMAAPDHADRLITESLKALCVILNKEGQVVGVYVNAFRLLFQIVKQSHHYPVIESGVVGDLVKWLSPRHSVTYNECKRLVFEICQELAQQSDDGRKALLEAEVLPVLLSLSTSPTPFEVIGACRILKALAHTGTFANDIVSARLKDAMESITSPFKKSTLQSKEDKQRARACAKEVLDTLKLSRHQSSASPTQTYTTPRIQRSVSDSQVPQAEPRVRSRRDPPLASQVDTSSIPSVDEPSEPLPVRHTRHARSFSETPIPSRPEGARLAAVHEDEIAPSIVEEHPWAPTTRLSLTTTPPNSGRLQADDLSPNRDEENPGIRRFGGRLHQATTPPNSGRLQADDLSPNCDEENPGIRRFGGRLHQTTTPPNSGRLHADDLSPNHDEENPGTRRIISRLPSYRTGPVPRSFHRQSLLDDPPDFRSTTNEEEDDNLGERNTPVPQKLMSSIVGSVRRR